MLRLANLFQRSLCLALAVSFIWPSAALASYDPRVEDRNTLDASDGSPSDVITIDAAGNVGITDTTPDSKLDINGSVIIEGTLTLNGTTLQTGASWIVDGGNSTNSTVTVGTNDDQGLALETNGVTAITINDNGYVGIGTTSPEDLLEVQGAEATDAIITLDADDGDDNADTWEIRSDASDNQFYVTNHASDLLTVASNGDVGIGASSPGAQLQVTSSAAGSIAEIIKGAASQSANLTEWQNGSGTVLSKVNSTGAIFPATGSSGGIQWTDGAFIKQSTNYLTLSSYTGFVIASTQAGGNIFATDNATVYAYKPIQVTAAKGIGLGTNSIIDSTNTLIFKAYDNYTFTTTGGTTATVANLSNTGNFSSYGLLYPGNNSAIQSTSYLSGTASGIGIGTTAPQSLLDVQGPTGTGATGAGILTLATKELTIVDGDELGRINFNAPLESDGSDSILAGAAIWAEADDTFSTTVNSSEIVFGTATTSAAVERMRIDSSGNVGIGTSTPATKLDVDGAIKTSSQFRGDFLNKSDNSASIIGNPSDYVQIYDGDGGNGIRIVANGDVGIGTTSPSSVLDVVGDITASNSFLVGDITLSNGSLVAADGTLDFGSAALSTTGDTSTNKLLAAANINGTNLTMSGDINGANLYTSSNITAHGNATVDGSITGLDLTINGTAFYVDAGSNSAAVGTTSVASGFFTIEGDTNSKALLYLNETATGGDIISSSVGATLSTAGVWTDVSDKNRKYDITDLKYSLDDLLKLRPVSYKFKTNDAEDIGFIAQEVKEIIPEVVYGEDGNMSMSYSHLTSLLVKSMQEFKVLNDQQNEEIKLLKQIVCEDHPDSELCKQ